ncbi:MULTISPECIES: L-threonylcarbamoyladenylate synthase [Rhodomicrobium]|uniref:L-threonylcarbamoyladenylate synthase n=1 Tax=Rhodomicrobium TaxID=1068 RepID=UPI000B4B763E|nr:MULTISPECIES: L-threonylcarbamoyladenylate synthase [Rhodomicrobium]
MPVITEISPENMREAARLIRAGRLVAFPTETVYGLGANALDGEAVARIFEAKGRPRFNPLIVHVADMAGAEALAAFSPDARDLAAAFWPGPLSLVLPRRAEAGLSDLVSAGLPTVALRVPAHDGARALIRAAGVPLAGPSANLSGQVSPTTAVHVAADLGDRVDMILDGGPCAEGLESTIVGFADGEPVLLRAGAVPREAIEAVLGRPLAAHKASAKPQAPGMLASHYAPRAQLRLNAERPKPGEAFLGFGPHAATAAASLNLSASGDLREAAANLFAHLRLLDAAETATIAVAPIPEAGLGEAINDRLRRAAAPRT